MLVLDILHHLLRFPVLVGEVRQRRGDGALPAHVTRRLHLELPVVRVARGDVARRGRALDAVLPLFRGSGRPVAALHVVAVAVQGGHG